MDIKQMRQYIRNFSFDNCLHGNQGFSRLLIQLFGFMGHGKSSFINSCKFVVDNRDYKIHVPVSQQHGAKTLKRDAYALTNNITLVDNRGCAKLDGNEAGEIYAQLGNIQPLGQEVKWDTDYHRLLRQLLRAGREDRSGDFIAPAFVYSAQGIISSPEFKEIKKILTKAIDITKLFPAVIITHETHQNLQAVKNSFRRMGVQLIFTVENYTQEDHLKIRIKHEKILRCLYEIIKDVEFRMEEIRNPHQEMEERKKILHTFLIVREIDRVREEERQESQRREKEVQEARDKERRKREVQEARDKERRAREVQEARDTDRRKMKKKRVKCTLI